MDFSDILLFSDFFDPRGSELFKAPFTALILLITSIITYQAFQNANLKHDLIFNAYQVYHRKQWHRIVSAGLIHANWIHFGMNAFVLWEFGRIVEQLYFSHFGNLGRLLYVTLYVLGIVAASLFSLFRHKDNQYYNALGASGAVSGIVFAFILFNPTAPLMLIFIPIPIPAIILGILYLAYSSYMGKRGGDNIGHDAHFWGSVWGFAFTAVLDPSLLKRFVINIQTLFQ